jgi:hypothetical protein
MTDMNRRQVIKTGLACVLAPIIPIETAKGHITARRLHGIVRLKLNPEQQRIYDAIQNSPNKELTAAWPRHDGEKQVYLNVTWDETTQMPIIKHITPQELYKKA